MCLVVPVHVLYFISKQTLVSFVLKEAEGLHPLVLPFK